MTLDDSFHKVCTELAKHQHLHRTTDDWPSESLRRCGRAGVFYGLSGQPLPLGSDAFAGESWDAVTQTDAWIRLAQADLLTTFVITQHLGAIKRILGSDAYLNRVDSSALGDLLSQLLTGDQAASVGISHLTTSRRHLTSPVVAAAKVEGGYLLNGTVPWVTGANKVDFIVAGGTLEDTSQILLLLSSEQLGMTPGPGAQMIAMTASCTDAVELDNVFVADQWVLSGPSENVLSPASTSTATTLPANTLPANTLPAGGVTKPGGAGGLQTSALAVGLSYATLAFLREEARRRDNLTEIVNQFETECDALRETLICLAAGDTAAGDTAKGAESSNPTDVRAAANSLVSRITTAAMTTAKGAGLMVDHPVARYSQQAFFFLVWSCPQSVAEAHLCELVGQ